MPSRKVKFCQDLIFLKRKMMLGEEKGERNICGRGQVSNTN